jgi:hypothetical protein
MGRVPGSVSSLALALGSPLTGAKRRRARAEAPAPGPGPGPSQVGVASRAAAAATCIAVSVCLLFCRCRLISAATSNTLRRVPVDRTSSAKVGGPPPRTAVSRMPSRYPGPGGRHAGPIRGQFGGADHASYSRACVHCPPR